jgi:lysophospholipase L1-like esterase
VALALGLLTCIAGVARAGDVAVKSGQKIAFVGHYVTGNGFRPGGFVTLTLLGLKANGIEVTAINASRGGSWAGDMLDNLDHDALSKKPDWLVLNCGGNDAWSKHTMEEFKDKVAKIVERANAAGVRVLIFSEPTIYKESEMLVPYNDALKSLAAEKKCLWTDLYTPFQAARKANPWACLTAENDFQPNAQGYLIMTRGILKAFGLSDEQMATADKAILDQPNTYECSFDLKIGLTLRQIQKLDEIAKQRKMKTDEIIQLLFTAELFPGAPPKTRAEVETFLEANRGKDPWTLMQTDLGRRLNVLLPK